MEFLDELSNRNLPLFIFGLFCLGGAIITSSLIFTTKTQVLGINAWIKPTKFLISSVFFVWTMAWLLYYLKQNIVINMYVWVVIGVMAFELVYIIIKAAAGEMSHFNISGAFNATMFSLMGIAISLLTLFTAFIGYRFFVEPLPELSTAYLWGIRLGIILFVVFAFEGGIMGARLSHTVGGPDGEIGLPFLNWSMKYGDLRIAHFVGMHALQVLPFVGYHVVNSSKGLFIIAFFYFFVAILVLIQALMGIPLVTGDH